MSDKLCGFPCALPFVLVKPSPAGIQAGPGQPDLGVDTRRPWTCPPFTFSANLLSGPHLQMGKQVQEGPPTCLRVSRAEAGEGQALWQWALEPFPGPRPGQRVLGCLRPWKGPGGAPGRWRLAKLSGFSCQPGSSNTTQEILMPVTSTTLLGIWQLRDCYGKLELRRSGSSLGPSQ